MPNEPDVATALRDFERDLVGIEVAKAYARLSTCPRRSVGCLLTDAKGRPLSVGYNGVASGRHHCTDHPCPGAGFPSGQGLDKCEAIHAEQNAILQLRDPEKVHTAYVTTFPCISCIKLLLGTSCQRIVFAEGYAHPEAMEWWIDAGRTTVLVKTPEKRSETMATGHGPIDPFKPLRGPKSGRFKG